MTAKKRQLLDEALTVVDARYMVFTDVAVGKLHLNYRSYGLKRNDLEDYWRAFVVGGYELVAYAKEHYAASTALYKKKPPAANRGC